MESTMTDRTKNVISFTSHEVRRLLAHSLQCRERSPTFDQMYKPEYRHDHRLPPEGHIPSVEEVDLTRVPPGLLLVADESVYLASNGLPNLRRHDGAGIQVVYAIGMDPRQTDFDIWWQAKQLLMGSDDQILFLSADEISQAVSDSDQLTLAVVNNGQFVTQLWAL
jgi:hypothetical protein